MASSAMQHPLPFPEGPSQRPVLQSARLTLRRVVAPGADPYRGLHLVPSVLRPVNSQAQAHAIVAQVEQQFGPAGEYKAAYTPHPGATFFTDSANFDTPLTAVRRILYSLRSLARIA